VKIQSLFQRTVWLIDLDGTLIDSSEGVVRAFHAAQSALQEEPAEPELIRASIGYPFRETVSRLSQLSFDDFFPLFREEALATMHMHSRLLPGAAELLATLAGQQKRLAVVTSKRSDNAHRILERLEIASYFSTIVGDETCAHNKPHPEPILHALSQLRAVPSDAVVLGDTTADIGAAHAAGVPVIAVGGGTDSPELLKDADLFAPDIMALNVMLRQGENGGSGFQS
jgi:phosphoglycolate phosphatase